MWTLGSFAFAAPWMLLTLAGVPLLWWLLRLTPPAPKRLQFPAIRLLLDLIPREETPHRTPLWLIIFRILLADHPHHRRWPIRSSIRYASSSRPARCCWWSTTAGRRRRAGRSACRR